MSLRDDDPATIKGDELSKEDEIFRGAESSSVDMVVPTPSLQEAFKAWKKSNDAKKELDVELDILSKLIPTRNLKDPCHKQALRVMFLDLVRSFLGVPYAKRFHQPDEACVCDGCRESGRQLYYEPLFADCCSLVRRAARRMEQHLGFRLGPGNQAYQFDTLPIRVSSVERLEPGDLIFYSGTCYNPDSKRYHFNMTHVEVFIGGDSGEATIGSRERYKWVKEYDSYQFKSARWSLIQHHFCKIDTWLEGVCAPQNPTYWTASVNRGSSSLGGSSQTAGPARRPFSASARRSAYSRALLGNVGSMAAKEQALKSSYSVQSSEISSRENRHDAASSKIGYAQGADEDGQEAGDD
ncbi:hypothetical protein CEUSTIGMA_g1096.t1 [Chlamydomonas eustigma]|uniref:NlpC/P60 domain-containing protein n=1 Tax=Chlamydomonas eustigma TaxID=1157962 RepID=A0A250WS27_9CHLO|nr:hypothetical protein CEUSTIGMA_g1096.t1 [Chlamydomonas eustigma]|eukprot:GAX73645.1 hypothetical protein CEUSTIGMA_g1096.t1 [Chlamydomonas eustigma]